MKNVQAYLSGRRVQAAFTTKMKNGKTRFEQKRFDRFAIEKRAIAARYR